MTRLSDKIRAAVDASGLGRNEIARRARIDKGAFSRFMAGRTGLSLSTLDRLAEALRLDIVSPRAARGSKSKRRKGER